MEQINALVQKKVEEFNELKKQNDAVDIALTTLASTAQGCFIGEGSGAEARSVDLAAASRVRLGPLLPPP